MPGGNRLAAGRATRLDRAPTEAAEPVPGRDRGAATGTGAHAEKGKRPFEPVRQRFETPTGSGSRPRGRHVRTFQPGAAPSLYERVPGLGQQRRGVVRSPPGGQPFAVLEQNDRQVEGQVERSQLGRRSREAPVGGRVVAGETGAEAVGDRREEGREEPDGLALHDDEELVGLGLLAELQRSFERVQKSELDALEAEPEQLVACEGALGDRERVSRIPLGEPESRGPGFVAALLLDVARPLVDLCRGQELPSRVELAAVKMELERAGQRTRDVVRLASRRGSRDAARVLRPNGRAS